MAKGRWTVTVLALGAMWLSGCASGVPEYADDPDLNAMVDRRIAAMDTLRGADAWQNLQAVAAMRLTALPRLETAMLTHPSPRVRAGCAQALGLAQDSKVVGSIARVATEDENAGVRYTAAYNLLLFQDSRGLPILIEALSSEDPSHRRDANLALTQATGRDFGFNPVAEPEVRGAAAARWKEWYDALGPDGRTLALIRR